MARVSSALLVLLATAGACGGASTSRTSTTAKPLVGRAFGDATVGARVLSLDPASEQATVAAPKGKHLIVLAVVPGKEIEVIAPGNSTSRRGAKGVLALYMRRVDDSPVPMDADDGAKERLAYDRCMAQAQAAARRAEQARRTTKRDSSGKEIPSESRGGGEVDDLRRFESQCEGLANAPKKKQPPRYLPARAPAERYLVVLASDAEIPLVDLYQRLATLTAVAPDAATTIEAIAAGLYVGVTSPWGGHFVAW